jgi:hypothetical protein
MTTPIEDTDAFKPLTDELFREYTFSEGHTLRIEAPQKLHVSASGGHYVLDSAGVSHYIRANSWRTLKWEARPGEPRFSFLSPKP